MSQQALREAFSEAELLAAKKKHQQVQEHMQVRVLSGSVNMCGVTKLGSLSITF